ncbi:hypothetical protein D9M68_509020 [compost metagenome]
MRQAHGPRRLDVFQLAVAQELGAHEVGQVDPAEQREQHEEQQQARLEHRSEDDQQVQLGHRAPDLDETLADQVDLAGEVALQRADRHAEQGADQGQRQAEGHRGAKAVEQAGDDVVAGDVGAQPVLRAGRPGVVGGAGEVAERVVVVGVEGVQREVAGLRQLRADERVVVVSVDRQLAAEQRLGVVVQQREEPLLLVIHQQRAVVADQLAGQAQRVQAEEQQQAPVAQAVTAKAQPQTAAGRQRGGGHGRARVAPAAEALPEARRGGRQGIGG